MPEKTHPESESKSKNDRLKSYDVILIFVTAFAAPLIAHACDVAFGKESNPLSSEKLLCAYFSLIATYVIYEFLLSYYKETSLWAKGWKLGNSNALVCSSFIVVATATIGYYNTLEGTLFIIAIFILFMIILLFKPDRVKLSSRSMLLFAMMVTAIIPAILLAAFNSGIFNNLEHLAWIWFGQFFVCFVFDGAYVSAKKLTKRDNNKVGKG